jgi:HEPN domain-containing protein
MVPWDLADEYYRKACVRRAALTVLQAEGGHDDVVRESQELVELVLKGLLRKVGVEPPKVHDVSRTLREHETRLPQKVRDNLERVTRISSDLRKEREISFYGDEDFYPSENYTIEHSSRWIGEVDWLLELTREYFRQKPRSP